MYFAYLVQCADGTLYGGYTTDLQKRMEADNRVRGPSTPVPACRWSWSIGRSAPPRRRPCPGSGISSV